MDALRVARITPVQTISLDFVGQVWSRNLVGLVQRIRCILLAERPAERPNVVLAPPYEAGHPDHDSLAFAVHLACRMLAREKAWAIRIFEYALYHCGSGRFCAGEFLPCADHDPIRVGLSARAEATKRRMMNCFATQRTTLQPFITSTECSRSAPRYDFRRPPHTGKLYYESISWGVTGKEWRQLAAVAARELEADCV
jgi:N-acetylglucosamine malate deacetylase 2